MLFRAAGFSLLGWRRPHDQHDIAELIDFVAPRWCAFLAQHSRSARRLEPGGVQQVDGAKLAGCLSLCNLVLDSPDLQRLITRWHNQHALHALDSSAPWLFIQLPRGSAATSGHVIKNNHPVIFTKVLWLPVFISMSTLEVKWQPYCLQASVVHHGLRLDSGHYNVLRFSGEQTCVLDDDKMAARASSRFLEIASCNAYILVLTKSPECPVPRLLAQASDRPHVGSEQHLPTPQIRRQLDSGSLESDGIPAQGARGTDDGHATSRGQHPGSDALGSAAREPPQLPLLETEL